MNPESVAAYFQSIAESIPWWLLLIGASVGHGYMLIIALNVLYAWPLPHGILKYTRKIDLMIAAAGPLVFAAALDVFDTRRLEWSLVSWRGYLSGYTVLCWLMGAGI